MADLQSNPFAILTFIAAPAILTNAASVLALGTSNRFARNVDRVRLLIQRLEDKNVDTDPAAALYRRQLPRYELRERLLIRSLASFYFSIGSFAAGSLTSLLGAVLAGGEHTALLRPILVVAMLTGVAGLWGLIVGGALLVRETRIALAMIHEEASFYRSRYPSVTNP